MAKSKSTKRGVNGRAAKKTKQSRTTARPRQAPLPGTEHLSVRELDDTCESLCEVRTQMNELTSQEQQLKLTALKQLRKHDRSAYKYAGIELARVPGDEKVRVRLVKGEGASDDDDAADAENGGAIGMEA